MIFKAKRGFFFCFYLVLLTAMSGYVLADLSRHRNPASFAMMIMILLILISVVAAAFRNDVLPEDEDLKIRYGFFGKG